MPPRKKTSQPSFKAAYQILKTNAETLQNSDEPDIDNLMKTVEQSIAAYKVCQARIEAVQRALDAAFAEDTADAVVETVAETTDKTLSTKAALEQGNDDQDNDKRDENEQEADGQEDD